MPLSASVYLLLASASPLVSQVEPSGGGRSRPDLVTILLDLTFYAHTELVEAALELLVRHFQQRATLYEHGRNVMLLVKPEARPL